MLQGDDLLQAAVLHLLGHVVGILARGERTGPLGIIEHICGVEAHLLEEGQGVAMVLLRLGAEARDDIGGNGAVRHVTADRGDALEIPGAGVAAAHLLQHAVGAGLHGKMDVVADVGVRGHHLQHLVGDVLGVGGREAHAQTGACLRHQLQQCGEVAVFVFIGIDVLPQQGNLLVALLRAVAGLADYGMIVTAALGAAGVGHDAVGADVVASAHDGDESGNSVAVETNGNDFGVGFFARQLDVDLRRVGTGVLQQHGKGAVGVGAGHDIHLAALQQLFLHALRHASQNAHQYSGALAALDVELFYAAVDALLGVVAYGACVRHDHIRLLNILRPLVAALAQQSENHLRIRHIHLAAVRFDIKLFHYLTLIFLPILRMVVGFRPLLRLQMCETVVPYLWAMPERVSPERMV